MSALLQTTRVVTLVTHPDRLADWLTFWGKAITALAWPLALVILALTFRKPIYALLEKLSDFEGWGFKASFKREVGKLAEETARAALPPLIEADASPASTPDPQPVDHEATAPAFATKPQDAPLDSVLPEGPLSRRLGYSHGFRGGLRPTSSPREIVMYGWQEVEQALSEIGLANGLPAMTWAGFLGQLAVSDKLQPETARLIENAFAIRNRLAHHAGQEPDYTEAVLYLTSAQSIAQAIRRDARGGQAASAASPNMSRKN